MTIKIGLLGVLLSILSCSDFSNGSRADDVKEQRFVDGVRGASVELGKGNYILPLRDNFARSDKLKDILRKKYQVVLVSSREFESNYQRGFSSVMYASLNERLPENWLHDAVVEAGLTPPTL